MDIDFSADVDGTIIAECEGLEPVEISEYEAVLLQIAAGADHNPLYVELVLERCGVSLEQFSDDLDATMSELAQLRSNERRTDAARAALERRCQGYQ